MQIPTRISRRQDLAPQHSHVMASAITSLAGVSITISHESSRFLSEHVPKRNGKGFGLMVDAYYSCVSNCISRADGSERTALLTERCDLGSIKSASSL